VLIDSVRGNVPATGVRGYSEGNQGLRPEIGDTLTYGIVLQPRFIPRLSFSVDRYEINIQDAITVLTGQQTVDQCAQGATEVCKFIQRDPTTGNIALVYTVPYNLAARRVNGYDFEATYRLPLEDVWHGFGGGSLTFRSLATYLGTDISVLPGAPAVNRAGELASLKWRANTSVTYQNGGWTAFLEARYIDAGIRDATWREGIEIDDNTFPSTYYLNMRVSRAFQWRGGRLQVVGTIDNLLDRQPVLVGTDASQSSPFSTTTDYDLIGRAFRLGVNFQF
jgi:iron complex outermembrane receptor protein